MVKRFFCDYCDASYPYSVEARKKHNMGHFHRNLRKQHYDQYRTAKERLDCELQKGKCRNFHSGRQCHFGDNCVFSHLTPSDFEQLKQDVIREEETNRQSKLPTLKKRGTDPGIEEWESRITGKDEHSSRQEVDLIEEFREKYKLPSSLKGHNILPPSLIPPTVESLLSCDFQDWG